MTKQQYEDEDNNPEVIKAKAEAKQKILEARAQLHPAAQIIYTLFDSVGSMIETIGCLLILIIIALALFAPAVLPNLFGK